MIAVAREDVALDDGVEARPLGVHTHAFEGLALIRQRLRRRQLREVVERPRGQHPLAQLLRLVDEAGRRELTIREALALFCEREIARKDERRIEMSVGLARFPFARDLAGFDFAAQPSIDKGQIRELATGRFIANGEAVLLLGPPESDS